MNSDLKAGSKVGNYVLESYLGGGSFGAVWRARHETTDQVVALKLLTGALSSAETAAMRAEVELLAAFAAQRSRHVVNILGGGPEPVPHVVMEYIQGDDLASQLRDGRPLSQEQTIEVGSAIADALRALNESGIIHRDIKPANVMVDRDGVIKLTDFGIAKIVGYETMTMTGQAAMTMAYAAPEIWDDSSSFGRPSHKSDLYAMGVLLFQCLTGETPFRGNYGALYKAHTERPPDIKALPPETPPSLLLLIKSCLEKKQVNRPASAENCLFMLQRARVELAESRGEAPANEPRRFGPWQRTGMHPSRPWAWRARHQTTGEEATVELHFAQNLDYGSHLRRAVAAASNLTPLGAERLIETNRLLMHPEESWTGAPEGQFQFWVAREDRPPAQPASISAPMLATTVGSLAALMAAAEAESLPLALTGNLSVSRTGAVYLLRPGLDQVDATSELEALDLVRALPLEPEAAGLVAGATSFSALAESLAAKQAADATRLHDQPDATMVFSRGDTATGVPPKPEPEPLAPVAPIAAAAAVGAAAAVPAAAALSSLRMELRRLTARGGKNEFELSLRNSAGQPLDIKLDAFDASEALTYALPAHTQLKAGATERIKLVVSATKRRISGGKRTVPFTVAASSGGGNGGLPPITANGDFIDEPSRLPILAGGGLFGLAGIAAFAAIALSGGGDDDNSVVMAGGSPTATASVTATASPSPSPTAVATAEPTQQPPENPGGGDPPSPPPAPTSTVSGGTTQPPPPPAATATPVPAPPPPPPPPENTARPTEPSVSVSCTSGGTTATAGAGQQSTALHVNSGATINCNADISGGYQSISWSGGQASSSSTSFSTSFTTPANSPATPTYTIRVQVNWGGNPVIKTVTITVNRPTGTSGGTSSNNSGQTCSTSLDTQLCVGGGTNN